MVKGHRFGTQDILFAFSYWVLPEHYDKNPETWTEGKSVEEWAAMIDELFAQTEDLLAVTEPSVSVRNRNLWKCDLLKVSPSQLHYVVITMPPPTVAALPFLIAVPIEGPTGEIWLLEKVREPIPGGMVTSMSTKEHNIDAQTEDVDISSFLGFVEARRGLKNLTNTISVSVMAHLGEWGNLNAVVLPPMNAAFYSPVETSQVADAPDLAPSQEPLKSEEPKATPSKESRESEPPQLIEKTKKWWHIWRR